MIEQVFFVKKIGTAGSGGGRAETEQRGGINKVGTKEGVEQLEMGRERGINAKTITQGVKFIPMKGDSD